MGKKAGIIFIAAAAAGIILRTAYMAAASAPEAGFIFPFIYAENEFAKLLAALKEKGELPLYYFIQLITAKIFGHEGFGMRLLPLFASILSIFIFFRAIRAFFPERAAVTAFVLFSLSPYHAAISAEEPVSALFLMISLLVLYYFMMSIKYNVFIAIPHVFWSVLGIYTHSWAWLLFAAINIIYFTGYRDEIRRAAWIKAQIVILCLGAPYLIFMAVMPSFEKAATTVAGNLMLPAHYFKDFVFGRHLGFSVPVIGGCLIAAYYMVLGIFTKRGKSGGMVPVLASTAVIIFSAPWLMSFFFKGMFSQAGMPLVFTLVLMLIGIGSSYLLKNGMIVLAAVFVILYPVSHSAYFSGIKNVEKSSGIEHEKTAAPAPKKKSTPVPAPAAAEIIDIPGTEIVPEEAAPEAEATDGETEITGEDEELSKGEEEKGGGKDAKAQENEINS
ncbi:MAG TPA: hypothetical protein ENN43_00065 [bacterium]|nr:hypothetical protein [bacterium]